jgi:hypothetical protein
MVPARNMVHVMSGRCHLLNHVDPRMHGAGWAHGVCYVRPVPPSRPCGLTYAWCWPGTWYMLCLAGATFSTMWTHVCMVLAEHMVYVMSSRYHLLDHVDPHMHGAGWAHVTCYVRPVLPSRPCGPVYVWYWLSTWYMLCLAGTTFSTICTHVCMVLAGNMVHVMSGRCHLLNHVDPCMHGAGRAHGVCYVRPVLPSRPCGPTYAWCRPDAWYMLCPAGTTFSTMWTHICMVPAGHMACVMSSRYHLLDHVDLCMLDTGQAHGICYVRLVLYSRPS